MSKHNNPIVRPNDLAEHLTKREYFAGLALQGLLACSSTHGTENLFAEDSVKYADALIDALNKTEPHE